MERNRVRADGGEPAAVRAPRRHWYGWQLLAADGGSFVLLFMSEETAGLGALSYLFTPPIIHWAHGQIGTGFGSLGLRIGLPLAGIGLGALGGNCRGNQTRSSCNAALPAIGGLLGVAGAIAIDAAVLGYEDKPRAPSASRISPIVSIGRHDARVGLAGSF